MTTWKQEMLAHSKNTKFVCAAGTFGDLQKCLRWTCRNLGSEHLLRNLDWLCRLLSKYFPSQNVANLVPIFSLTNWQHILMKKLPHFFLPPDIRFAKKVHWICSSDFSDWWWWSFLDVTASSSKTPAWFIYWVLYSKSTRILYLLNLAFCLFMSMVIVFSCTLMAWYGQKQTISTGPSAER